MSNRFTYAFIYKNTGNLYGERQMDGFKDAVEESGGKCLLMAPNSVSTDSQEVFVREMIEKKVDAIAIAGNDFDALEPCLQEAMNAGIKVLSVDSAVNPESRIVHVSQANNAQIADYLVRAAYEMCQYEGTVGIVSTTPHMDNQSTWIKYMQTQLEQPPYNNLTLVDIVYGEDELEKSIEATADLLDRYPAIDVIIAPTVMGIYGASNVVQSQGRIGDVKVTGLGLPSLMYEYIEDGTCPWMYLWNPVEIGYLAGYTAIALVDGTITGDVGDQFEASRLGTFEIVQGEDGGTEIVLGAPFKFDIENIDEWKEAY